MEIFNVVYLEHSVFHEAEKKSEQVSRHELVKLLSNGMISVLEVHAVINC